RIHLRKHVAGEEAEPLTGLHRRAGEDDAADLALLHGRDRKGHSKVGLPRSGGADAEGDRALADRVDVALLVDGLRRDLRPAVTPDDVLEDLARILRSVERREHGV